MGLFKHAGGSRRDRRLITALFVTSLIALLISWAGVRQVEHQLLLSDSSDKALHWAQFLQEHLTDLDDILASGLVSAEDQNIFDFASDAGGVFRFELIRPDGSTALSSWPATLTRSTIWNIWAKCSEKGGGSPTFQPKSDRAVNNCRQRRLCSRCDRELNSQCSRGIKVSIDMTPELHR